jgi:hypothetical protein
MTENVQKLPKQELIDFVAAHIATTEGKTPLIIGGSGFGKTAILKGFENLGYEVSFQDAATLLTSIRIIPDIQNGFSKVVMPSQSFKERLEQQENGKPFLVLIEEVQGIAELQTLEQLKLRQLIVERLIGNQFKIGDHVRFVLLGNNGSQNGYNQEIESMMAEMLSNNIVTVELVLPTVADWFNDAENGWGANVKWCKPFTYALKQQFTNNFPAGLTPRGIFQVNAVLAKVQNVTIAEQVVTSSFDIKISQAIIPLMNRAWNYEAGTNIGDTIALLEKCVEDSEVFECLCRHPDDIDVLLTKLLSIDKSKLPKLSSKSTKDIGNSLQLSNAQKAELHEIFTIEEPTEFFSTTNPFQNRG